MKRHAAVGMVEVADCVLVELEDVTRGYRRPSIVDIKANPSACPSFGCLWRVGLACLELRTCSCWSRSMVQARLPGSVRA